MASRPQKIFEPLAEERTVEGPLEVEGAIPAELVGMLVRNGPNPADPGACEGEWLGGDGMVHSIELRDQKAISYSNKWVRTERLARVLKTRRARGPREPIASPANANVIWHGGRILALHESGLPYRLASDLSTIEVEDFDAMLASPLTSHPKIDPQTEGLAAFGYDLFGPPNLRYHEFDAEGTIVHSSDIDIPEVSLQHDFAVTSKKVAFFDLPVVRSGERSGGTKGARFQWLPELGAQIGIMDRGSSGSSVRWLETDPCWVSHVVNAFDSGEGEEAMTIDVCCYETAFDAPGGAWNRRSRAVLERWEVKPNRNQVERTRLDDLPIDLPRVDPHVAGRRYRYSYCVVFGSDEPKDPPTALVRYDVETGQSRIYDPGDTKFPGEPIFVRAERANADDEGWVLTVVYDATRDMSDLVILDASSFGPRPQAVVHLPNRIPFGFHGSWIPAAKIW